MLLLAASTKLKAAARDASTAGRVRSPKGFRRGRARGRDTAERVAADAGKARATAAAAAAAAASARASTSCRASRTSFASLICSA